MKRYHQVPSIEVIIRTRPIVMTLKYPLLQNLKEKTGYLKRNRDYFKVIQKEDHTDIYFSKEMKFDIPSKEGISTRIEKDVN